MNDESTFYRRLIKKGSRRIIEVFSVGAGLILWQLVSVLIIRDQFSFPSFSDVLLSFVSIVVNGTLFTDLIVSLMHFGIGLFAALSVGIPLGIAMGWFKRMNRSVNPLIEILRPIPPLAWIPFAMSWFGLTHRAAGFVVFVGMIFPVIINTYTGFNNIPKVYVEAAKVLGCTRDRDLIRYVAFPSAVPSVISGIRIAMGTGWMCLVAAEMFGVSSDGLGYELWQSFHLHRMDYVFMYMLLLGFLGFFIDSLFQSFVGNKLLVWKKGIVV